MAIQVSYLEQKLYPSWFKTGPESVSSFKGDWPSVKPGSVSSFAGDWPTAPTHEGVTSFRGNFPEGVTAGTVKGFIGGWPRAAKHEEVKSFKGNFAESTSPPTDEWMEIGQPYFHVNVEINGTAGADLGFWVKLDGLSMKVDVAEHRTGDGMNYRWIEPTVSSFPNIKLSRAATARGCKQTLRWLIDAQSGWKRGMTLGIEAKPMWYKTDPIAYFKIGLVDVMPVAWATNGFATDGKLAMETLELAYSQLVRPDVNPAFPSPPVMKPRAEFTPPPGPTGEKKMSDLTGGQESATGDTG
jgi:T4-like virus tail tube protein gp19